MSSANPVVSITLSIILGAAAAHAQPMRRHALPHGPYLPHVSHVFMIILENTDQSLAVDQPYLSELGGQGAVLTNYHALPHPSQPNYIALVAGSAYGATDDTPVPIDVKPLGTRI